MTAKIIGVSGNRGAGKSTLVSALALELKAAFVSWDDFDDISQGPADMYDWYVRGENYEEWDYNTLAAVLKTLKSGQSATHPAHGQVLNGTEYFIFDGPLGKLHRQTGQHIDFWVHIQVPLDVSLARWLVRDFKGNDRPKDELLAEIEYYLSHARPLYFDDDLKQTADFVVDGMFSPAEQVKEVKRFLEKYRSMESSVSCANSIADQSSL